MRKTGQGFLNFGVSNLRSTKGRGDDDRTRTPGQDSEGLGCWGNEVFRVGYVSEVNGPDSVEISKFVPTRYELINSSSFGRKSDLTCCFPFFWTARLAPVNGGV
jgi:hypothetical protein